MKSEKQERMGVKDWGMVALFSVIVAGYFLWPSPLVWAGLEKEPPACRFFDSKGQEFSMKAGDPIPAGTRIKFTGRSFSPPTDLAVCFEKHQ